jgi:predicted transcriptional regulator
MEQKMSLEEDKYSKITLNKIFNVFNSVADTVIVSTKQIQASSSKIVPPSNCFHR